MRLAVWLVLIAVIVSGCKNVHKEGPSESSDENNQATDSYIETSTDTVDPSNAVYELRLQKNYHDDRNVVEIPLFYSNYESSVIELLNSTITDEIVRLCDEYEHTYAYSDPKNSIKLRCYTEESDDYLQTVVTYSTDLLTSNNNDGFVYSYIYDIKNDHLVTLNDAMAMSNINIQTIWEKAADFVYESYGENCQLLGCEPAAFRLLSGGSVVYLYMTINNDGYVSQKICSLISATGERGEVCDILENFDFNPSQNAEWTLPVQLELYNNEKDRCVYSDSDYAVSIEFPKDVNVSMAYESGYAAFASEDRTASAVYFTEIGRNIKEIEAMYPDGKNENGIFKSSYTSSDYTEYIFVIQSKVTDTPDDGYTHWLILTTDSSHSYNFDSASISVYDTVTQKKAETDTYLLTNEQKNDINSFVNESHPILYASLGKANYGIKNTLLIPSDIFKSDTDGVIPSDNIVKSLKTSYQLSDRAVARLTVSGHIIPRRASVTKLTLSITNGDDLWSAQTDLNIG